MWKRSSVLRCESRGKHTHLVVDEQKDAIIYVESFICGRHS